MNVLLSTIFGDTANTTFKMEPSHMKKNKLGIVSGVYIPVCLNILSILMFLRFGLILAQVGLLGMLGMHSSNPVVIREFFLALHYLQACSSSRISSTL